MPLRYHGSAALTADNAGMFPSDTSHHAHLDRSRPGCWRGAWLLVLFFVGALACAQVMPLSEAYRDAAAARMPEARTLVDQVLADAAAVNRPVYDLLSAEETAAVGTSTGAVQQEAETLNAALSALRIGELMDRATPTARPITMLRAYDPDIMATALSDISPRLPDDWGDWFYGVLGGVALVGTITLLRALLAMVTDRFRRPRPG
ncbi:MAG: DUF2937 family protein [Rhodospirillaceae bacterium]|nr:DUF2937 family protein [Rhodospirillaceae bacterium]